MFRLERCLGRARELDDRGDIFATHTRPEDFPILRVESFLAANRLAFHAIHVIENDFAKEIGASAKASALRENLRFLHASQPKDFIVVRLESFERNRLPDGDS